MSKYEWTKDSEGVEWISDKRGNKCSVKYFGNKEEAEKALKSLVNCDDCVNCRSCRYCSDCSYCSYCSDCRSCRSCSYCSSCSSCRYCSDCSYCSYCSDCSYCRSCSYCSDCSSCRSCSSCSSKKGDFKSPVIPVIKSIHQEVYKAVSKPNALEMGDWHTCDTTHCRAGWVVALAGEEGKALEKYHGTCLAAQLIYRKSSSIKVSLLRFFDTADEAMADMKKMAELEVTQEDK